MAEVVNKFGKLIGWKKITVNVMGRDLEGISRIAYGDKVTKTNAYGAGNLPVGREEGNYEPDEVVLALFEEEARGLMLSNPSGRIQEIAPFDITVEYELPNGVILRDRIMDCEFTTNGKDVKQGDGKIVTEYKLISSVVNWNTI
ncbi:MAG: hypothetical protein ACEQSR_01345 [Candidatus Methylacidiphilales bacterium]